MTRLSALLVAGLLLTEAEGEPDPSPLAARFDPVLKKAVPKAEGKSVLIVALAAPGKVADEWRVVGAIRDEIARSLQSKGVKARIDPKVEALLDLNERAVKPAPIDLGALRDLSPCDAILTAQHVRKGNSATVQLALIDAKRRSTTWKASVVLRAQDLSIEAHIPPLNRQVLRFAVDRMGKQVGNGECWTLVAEALESAGAGRDGTYGFGRELGPRDPILPGDAIQFEKAVFRGAGTLEAPHHSALVHRVMSPTRMEMIEQNNQAKGKIVAVQEIDLHELKEGTVQFFRPRPK